MPTVVPTDSRPLSCPPIGALPRNRLAASATGGASPISPPTGGAEPLPYAPARKPTPRADRVVRPYNIFHNINVGRAALSPPPDTPAPPAGHTGPALQKYAAVGRDLCVPPHPLHFPPPKPTVSLIPPLFGPRSSTFFRPSFGRLKIFIIMLKLCKIFLHSKKIRFPNGFSEFPLAVQINKVYCFINGFLIYFFFYCQQINGKWCYSLSIDF